MAKILMLNQLNASFIKQDYEILKELGHKVDIISAKNIFEYLKQWQKAKGYDIYFSWWGTSLHTVLFAKIFGGKSIIIAGGGDVTYVPKINYGGLKHWWKRMITQWTLEHADLILAVSKFTKKEVLKFAKPKRIKVVYNGINFNKFKINSRIKKNKNLIITVGTINWSNLKRKGIEKFVRLAKHLLEKRFVIIGKFEDDSINYLKKIATDNVLFTGFVSDEELIEWYQKAKIYLQLSEHEGFGCSVVEAIACKCIPIVSGSGALLEIVGSRELCIMNKNPKIIASKIEIIIKQTPLKVVKSAMKFDIKKRREKIKQVI